jgi:HSP20 family protein
VNVPSVNVRETPKEYILEVAAPGLERKDFNIEVDNRTLTISAEKEEKKEEKSEDNGYSRREYSFNSFSRSFTLPEDSKESNIDAKYENGILKLTLPKSKESTSKTVKRIEVS